MNQGWKGKGRGQGQGRQDRAYHPYNPQNPAHIHVIFAVPIEELYMKFKHMLPTIPDRQPPRIKGPNGIWCEYHKDYTHTLADCRTVRIGMSRLHMEGKMPGVPIKGEGSKAKEQATNKGKEIVHLSTISGGGKIPVGLSRRATKKIMRGNDAQMVGAVQYSTEDNKNEESWQPVIFT